MKVTLKAILDLSTIYCIFLYPIETFERYLFSLGNN